MGNHAIFRAFFVMRCDVPFSNSTQMFFFLLINWDVEIPGRPVNYRNIK